MKSLVGLDVYKKSNNFNKNKVSLRKIIPHSLISINQFKNKSHLQQYGNSYLDIFVKFTRDCKCYSKTNISLNKQLKKKILKSCLSSPIKKIPPDQCKKILQSLQQLKQQIKGYNQSAPHLDKVYNLLQQIHQKSVNHLYLHMMIYVLLATFCEKAGMGDKADSKIRNLIYFTYKQNLVELSLLGFQIYFKMCRNRSDNKFKIELLKKILKLSWKLKLPQVQLQCYTDLSLVYNDLEDKFKSLFFKHIYDLGQIHPDGQLKSLALIQIQKQSHLLKDGIFPKHDMLDLDLLISQYNNNHKTQQFQSTKDIFKSKDYMNYIKQTHKAPIKDQLRYIVKGPVRVTRGTRQFQINSLKDLNNTNTLKSHFLQNIGSNDSYQVLRTHLSYNKNLNMFYQGKRNQIYFDLQSYKASWKIIRQMLSHIEKETLFLSQ